MKKNERWTRRQVLNGMGAGFLLPFVPLLAGDVEAQTVTRKRLITFYHPNGYGREADYFPSGGETDFTLSRILAPLAEHRDDLVIFKGIHNEAGPDSGNYVHIPHMGSVLTGSPIQRDGMTPFFAGEYQYGWADSPSVDQILAERIMASESPTPFGSLDYHPLGDYDNAKTASRMSYTGPGVPVTPETDPREALARLAGLSGQPPLLQSERASALDFAIADLERLKGRVGSEDRLRLEGHLEAFRDLERRLDTTVRECDSVDLPVIESLRGGGSYRERGKGFLDLIVQALACDATRVCGMQWANAGGAGGCTFSWLGHTQDEHLASHDYAEEIVEVKLFYMEQLAYLISALKAVPEGDGTLFDSTMILVSSEHGNAATHSHRDIPFILAGSAGGAYSTGHYIDAGGVPQNGLLVSVCHAMGFEDITSVGSPDYGSGPLSALG